MKYDGISIIIPCYNVEMYLEGCLESIFKQNIENYEIILIDDCSSDKTAKIIKKYEKKYDFIKGIYNEKNSGAGYSRNQAIKMAKYNILSFTILEPDSTKTSLFAGLTWCGTLQSIGQTIKSDKHD